MKKAIARILLVASLLCLPSCNSAVSTISPAGMDGSGQWIFQGNVKVGRVVPLTGNLASFGDGTPYVEQSAIDAVNKNGGVIIDGKRCRLDLVYADSGSGTTRAADAATSLIRQGIDIMMVSNTADTVSPVSAVCERMGIACISVDAPADAWLNGGPYKNSWHAHFNNENELSCFADAWNAVDNNKTVGLLAANDIEGIEMATFIKDFASFKGYAIVDPGRFTSGSEDFGEIIKTLRAARCDILVGVMTPSDFDAFWSQCHQAGYIPKLCTVAKACLFENDIRKLGRFADGLVSEVWWSADFPFTSSINGCTSAALAADYLKSYAPTLSLAPPTVGYKYANVEILYDILRRAGSLSLKAINGAAAKTDLSTIIGHVSFNSEHVSIMNCVTGQWVIDKDGSIKQEIICNTQMPHVPVTATIIKIPES